MSRNLKRSKSAPRSRRRSKSPGPKARTRSASRSRIAPKKMMKRGGYKTNIIDPETDVTLNFFTAFTMATAGTNVSRRWTVNSAYDVDPTLGSTSTPGFAEYAAFYNFYRVVEVGYRVDVVNADALPMYIYVHWSNSDPGVSLSSQAIGNPLTKWKLLAAGGGMDTWTFTDKQTIATILGSDEVEYNEQYRSLTSGGPADIAWLAVAAHTAGGTPWTVGPSFCVSLRLLTRFFDRVTNLTAAPEAVKARAMQHDINIMQLESQLAQAYHMLEALGVLPPGGALSKIVLRPEAQDTNSSKVSFSPLVRKCD